MGVYGFAMPSKIAQYILKGITQRESQQYFDHGIFNAAARLTAPI
jgi:hypothetical protein